MIIRGGQFGKKERPKYPVLADKIVQMSDIILEILDARFIHETRNHELEEKIKKYNKKIIYVFNKADLVNIQKIDKKEIEGLSPKVFVSCTTRKGIKELRNKIKITSYHIEKKVDAALNKTTVGIIGYPNTGKSSVINLLVGKSSAGVGADAGYTKGIQKINLTTEIVLLDSPGVIPNREYSGSDISAISKHTKVGARSHSQVKDPEFVVCDLVKEFPKVLDNFYNVESNGDSEVLIEKVGRQKGFLLRGNEVDEDKTCRLILKDWQEGKIRR
ncbi:GTPase Der [uncultured archaeon]|nr:GTPase Der [uncultured archaeon]